MEKTLHTWRIIPVSKWLVTPIYKPFRPFTRGITPFRGLTITMVIDHLRPSWDGPPSTDPSASVCLVVVRRSSSSFLHETHRPKSSKTAVEIDQRFNVYSYMRDILDEYRYQCIRLLNHKFGIYIYIYM